MRTPVLVNRHEAARILGITPRTFARICSKFPSSLCVFKRDGQRHLYRKSDVLAIKKFRDKKVRTRSRTGKLTLRPSRIDTRVKVPNELLGRI